jgi:integrase
VSKSTKSHRARKADRPAKPYPDFPLTPHASGAWQKQIRGKIHSCGACGEAVGPVRLANTITRAKSVFKFGIDNGLIERAVRYGSEFKKPSLVVIRRHRAKAGEWMLEPEQLRKVIDAAPTPLKAMVLLGLNGGLGNFDCASLPMSAVDLGTGWLNYPRPKTGIGRRVPLWPETITAIREAIDRRPEPADDESCGLLFLTAIGTPWIRPSASYRSDHLTKRFIELLQKLGLHRERFGFYTLRHVFRTVADACRDTPAVDLTMGHADPRWAPTTVSGLMMPGSSP